VKTRTRCDSRSLRHEKHSMHRAIAHPRIRYRLMPQRPWCMA